MWVALVVFFLPDSQATFPLNFSGKCYKLAENKLKRCASLIEIFVSRYEGKYYTLGHPSSVMRYYKTCVKINKGKAHFALTIELVSIIITKQAQMLPRVGNIHFKI